MRIVFCLLLFGLFACEPAPPNQDAIQQEIKGLESDIRNNPTILDTGKALKVVDLYLQFQRLYPNDSLSPEYLFKAADVSRGTGRFEQALHLLKSFEMAYPAHPRRAVCVFLQGYIYQNDLSSFALADQAYQRFLENFPNHPLAPEARNMQAMMQIPEAELMDRFRSGKGLSQDSPDSSQTP